MILRPIVYRNTKTEESIKGCICIYGLTIKGHQYKRRDIAAVFIGVEVMLIMKHFITIIRSNHTFYILNKIDY